MGAGDLTVMAKTLDPDASWRAVHDGPWNCEGREAILETFSRNLDTGLRGTIEKAGRRARDWRRRHPLVLISRQFIRPWRIAQLRDRVGRA
jgi:hypothetical protein